MDKKEKISENKETVDESGAKPVKKPSVKPNLKSGDKVILISAMMQTCIAEYIEQDKENYYVKNPLLFASFPERDKENPNLVRTVFQAPAVWNRGIMSDVNQDQLCAFPKATYAIMYVDDNTNAPLFTTDVIRLYNSAWAKTDNR